MLHLYEHVSPSAVTSHLVANFSIYLLVIIDTRDYTENYICKQMYDTKLLLYLGAVHNCQHFPIRTESTNS